MTTDTSPRTVDARQAWDTFTTAAVTGKPTIAPFAAYRVALALADAADSKAKEIPYREACARYESIADRVNAANAAIASATISDGMATDVAQGPVRTAEEKMRQLAEANHELNLLAEECGASGYTPRADTDTALASTLHLGIEKPHAPSPRRPSSGFERNYGRALAAVLDKHFDAAEKDALDAWRREH